VIGDLFAAIAGRGSFQGMVVTEFEPELDRDGTSAMAIARVLCRALEARLSREP
jgi:arginase family enzyme